MSARSPDVVLVEAGGTNIGSLRYALQRLGVEAELSSDAARIRAATHVILPGVGAAAPGMQRLRAAGLVEVLRRLRQPVLGVCLGMQLLFEHSEEGDTPCLGLLSGQVRKLSFDGRLRVPHMGWNALTTLRADTLLAGLPQPAYAYFVHSYAAPVGAYTLADATHGVAFSAVVRHGNVCGMQFHPERSAAVGARLLQNFLAL
ncbi:imidazole glycerol phosphate synthase subunit HisH [Metallibacterium sp.]|uniref:imidazole glycerol phosphate synthase subunit HisH n=1 Tax=Metallibacterium sp. TaxID=2940281 RepID=UPI002604601B|nr:imidazole glycerol phosphate synthase subunit HisH [Metallibacterium sp.]